MYTENKIGGSNKILDYYLQMYRKLKFVVKNKILAYYEKNRQMIIKTFKRS